jgi:hypothetical protein
MKYHLLIEKNKKIVEKTLKIISLFFVKKQKKIKIKILKTSLSLTRVTCRIFFNVVRIYIVSNKNNTIDVYFPLVHPIFFFLIFSVKQIMSSLHAVRVLRLTRWGGRRRLDR